MRAWRSTLRGRLLVVFAAGLAFLLLALAVNVFQLRTIGRSLELVNRVYLPVASLSARMGGQMDPSRDTSTALARSVSEVGRVVDDAPVVPDEEEAAALAATRRQVEELAAAHAGFAAAPGRETRAALRDEVLQLNALVEARISAVSVKTGRIQDAALRQAGLFILIAVLMSGAVLYVTGAALAPVSRLTEQARQMAAGERVSPVLLHGDDEIATLAQAFARMASAVDDRDRHLNDLTLYLRRVLDSIGAAVVVVEGERVGMLNPPARALWSVEEGAPLPPELEGLGHGRHDALPVGDRFQDVVVRPFGTQGRILVGEDSTERVRDRARLQRSERLALVGQMLAQVTHEVRNPLNAMSLHAELLADDVEGEEGRAILATILAEIRRLEEVTERYLDLARRRPPESAPEDPFALARSVVALEEESLRRQGVEVHLAGAPGAVVEIDGNVLRRALLNLLRNAAEAGAHTVWVRIGVEGGAAEGAGGAVVRCEVRDDGPGMEPEVAARAFEPFFSTRARGTGLGLAITRQAIEDLDGRIECHSVPGEGTTFRLLLPAG